MSVSDWADLDDNRVGPILKELAAAIEGTEDEVTLYKIQRRLLFMSSAVNSLRQKREMAGGFATRVPPLPR